MTWFDNGLLGISKIFDHGTEKPRRTGLNFVGSLSVEENEAQDCFDVAVATFGPFATVEEFRTATPPGSMVSFTIEGAGTYVYKPDEGANVPDDGSTVLKPASVDLTANGRAYLAGGSLGVMREAARFDITLNGGGAAHVVTTTPIAELTDGELVAELRIAAGTSSRCIGSISAVISRVYNAPVILNQSVSGNWTNNYPGFAPAFSVSGDNIILSVTPHATLSTTIRGALLSSMGAMTVPEADLVTETTTYNALNALIGAKIIDVYFAADDTMDGLNVATSVGRKGTTRNNTGADRFTHTTLSGRVARTQLLASAACLHAIPAVKVKEIIAFALAPTMPFVNHRVLAATMANGAAEGMAIGGNSGSSDFFEGNDWTHYVDGVLTSAVPSDGLPHVFSARNAASVRTYHSEGITIANYGWAAPRTVLVFLNAETTTGELTSIIEILNTYHGLS